MAIDNCLLQLRKDDDVKALAGYYVEAGLSKKDFAKEMRAQFKKKLDPILSDLYTDAEAKIQSGEAHKVRKSRAQSVASKKIEALRQEAAKLAVENADPKKVAELTELMAKLDPNDPASLMDFVEEMHKPKFMDYVKEYWINSILSNTRTQMVNLSGNVFSTLMRPVETAVSASLSKLRKGAPKVYFREVPADLRGMVDSLSESWMMAKHAFTTEESAFGASIGLDIGIHKKAFKGKLGKFIRLPGRMLLAGDDFFKNLNYNGKLHALAARKSRFSENPQEAYEKFLSDPPLDLIEKAKKEAVYRTFQTELGKTGKALERFRNSHPALTFLLPFLRTPINLVKQGIEFTPIQAIRAMNNQRLRSKLERLGGQLEKGEISEGQYTALAEKIKVNGVDLKTFEEEVARPLIGMALTVPIAMMTAAGMITGGGPGDRDKWKIWRQNHRPYSIKIGNQWFEYGRLDPIAIPVGIIADIVELSQFSDDANAAAKAAKALANNLTNKTYMRSISELFELMNNPEKRGERFVSNYLSGAVPFTSLMGAIAREVDPTIRKDENIFSGVKKRIPGATKEMIPLRDIWGREIVREGFPVENMLNPIAREKVVDDPATKEMQRLKMDMPRTSRRWKGGLMNEKEYDRYLSESGKAAHEAVLEFIKNEDYKQASDDDKADVIRKIIIDSRADVRNHLYYTSENK